jgi:hypothetical protein
MFLSLIIVVNKQNSDRNGNILKLYKQMLLIYKRNVYTLLHKVNNYLISNSFCHIYI